MSNEDNRGEVNGNGAGVESSPSSPTTTEAPSTMPVSGGATNGGMPKQVQDVMYSNVGITTLLNRLKQSIASAHDFAAFLKKRSTLEEEQANGVKRLARSQLETLRRMEVKGGSYAVQLAEVMKVHDRMADNGMQFALSLHQMHEDLNNLSAEMERSRKQYKHEGLEAEKRASDAEAAMHKAKSRYDGLADDYDRARTGDAKGSKRIGLKGPKSAEQYEQDLQRKTQQADQEYGVKVKEADRQRQKLLSLDRPKVVKALEEKIRECDSALTLQLQKFATFNEKLILGNGLAVTPFSDRDNAGSQRSLRDIVHGIDNETDFNTYMRGHVNKIVRPNDIQYEQHGTLAPKMQKPSDRQASQSTFSHSAGPQSTQQPSSLGVDTTSGAGQSQPGSTSSRYTTDTVQQAPAGSFSQPPSSGSYGQQAPQLPTLLSHQQNIAAPSSSYSGSAQQQQTAFDTTSASPREAFSPSSNYPNNSQVPPYPTHPSERGYGSYGSQQSTGAIPITANRQPTQPTPQTQQNLPPLRPVFGVSLEELFQRDQTAVPMVVIQSILAVDTFGLDVEGIYRLSGTASHITQLKSQFDHNAAQIDFRNPAAFFHDVNSVATLLKQFFRDLPDPLFTIRGYGDFIDAAKIEDPNMRRDALHQCINDLPDPNYATLRAVVLHLHRVMVHESRNRMGSSNIALCFAPSLMGSQFTDTNLQARVLDTILVNATAIFDED